MTQSMWSLMNSIKQKSDTILNPEHGSPRDRGAADAYYRRAFNPHRIENQTKVEITDRTSAECKAYSDAYYADLEGQKDWGSDEPILDDDSEHYDS